MSINCDTSLAVGSWVGDPEAAVPISPHPRTFLSREPASLEYQ